MKKPFLVLCILLLSKCIFSQKVIHNPDYISSNISGKITKVEFTKSETILHFHIKKAVGGWIFIPKKTYIENALANEQRKYVIRTEGIELNKKHTLSKSDELRYKLYFPPLGEGVKKVNYGESNPGGNWFIYKLDVTKDGKNFLPTINAGKLNSYTIKEGFPLTSHTNRNQISTAFKTGNYINIGSESILPKDLPKAFFGNWYDKYGTLILITTPDYIVSDYSVLYYQDIQKNGDNKFIIKSTRGIFEVLNLENSTMTIRTDRLSTLKRKPSTRKIPEFIKGDWLHWAKVKKINITDDYFYNDDGGVMGVYDIIKSRVDHVAVSETGNMIWFVLYHEGNYNMYIARKTNGEYILAPRGFVNAKYKKVKN